MVLRQNIILKNEPKNKISKSVVLSYFSRTKIKTHSVKISKFHPKTNTWIRKKLKQQTFSMLLSFIRFYQQKKHNTEFEMAWEEVHITWLYFDKNFLNILNGKIRIKKNKIENVIDYIRNGVSLWIGGKILISHRLKGEISQWKRAFTKT